MEDLFNWSEYSEGNRSFRKALVDIKNYKKSRMFWDYWKENKDYLKKEGVRVVKEEKDFYIIQELITFKKEDTEEAKLLRSLSKATSLDVDIPKPKGKDYLPYQKAGIEFSKNRNALIADQPGLGKTIQAIGVINSKKKLKNILIVCPASLRINWKRELENWLTRKYSIGIVDRDFYPENANIVIINYDVVDRHKDKLHKIEWDLLIADEAHYLKNPDSKRTATILGRKKNSSKIRAKQKLFLTGTPILNKPVELFSLLNSLDPDRWTSFWKYAKRYCAAKHNGFGWDFSGSSNLEELQDILRSSVMVRRLKEDVLTDLPKKRRQIIELPVDTSIFSSLREEQKMWEEENEMLSALRASVLVSKVSENQEEYKQSVNNLQQGVSTFFSNLSKLREKIALKKLPYVIEHLKSFDGKVVVFVHHKKVATELKNSLGKEAVMLVGDTKMEDRQIAVDSFQTDPNVKYFIGSIMAAGVGITLTAASTVVFVELDWVPGNMSQAEDRCHRIGQKNSVLVQHLVLENSLDARIAEKLIKKQEVIDKALDMEYDISSIEPDIFMDDDINVLNFVEENTNSDHVFTENEKDELLMKIKQLASYDGDGAREKNFMGFNKFDSGLGHSLASQNTLSDKQAYIAKKLVKKYRRQLE